VASLTASAILSGRLRRSKSHRFLKRLRALCQFVFLRDKASPPRLAEVARRHRPYTDAYQCHETDGDHPSPVVALVLACFLHCFSLNRGVCRLAGQSHGFGCQHHPDVVADDFGGRQRKRIAALAIDAEQHPDFAVLGNAVQELVVELP
jgi:hypothetical protein